VEGSTFKHGASSQSLPSFTTLSHFSPLIVKIRFFLGNCQGKKWIKRGFTNYFLQGPQQALFQWNNNKLIKMEKGPGEVQDSTWGCWRKQLGVIRVIFGDVRGVAQPYTKPGLVRVREAFAGDDPVLKKGRSERGQGFGTRCLPSQGFTSQPKPVFNSL
jgi:hypothetical protein